MERIAKYNLSFQRIERKDRAVIVLPVNSLRSRERFKVGFGNVLKKSTEK